MGPAFCSCAARARPGVNVPPASRPSAPGGAAARASQSGAPRRGPRTGLAGEHGLGKHAVEVVRDDAVVGQAERAGLLHKARLAGVPARPRRACGRGQRAQLGASLCTWLAAPR
jgi:hypothetical protein